MTSRGSSPRVALRRRLRQAKKMLEYATWTLDGYTGQVYVPMDQRAADEPYLRDRREDEKMENLPGPWRSLAADFDTLADFFAREARHARYVADQIEATGVCPRVAARS